MRSLTDIIVQIENVLPLELINRDLFSYVKKDIFFTAPELMSERWNDVYYILLDNVNSIPEEDWEVKVWSIFSGLSEDEVREEALNRKNSSF